VGCKVFCSHHFGQTKLLLGVKLSRQSCVVWHFSFQDFNNMNGNEPHGCDITFLYI